MSSFDDFLTSTSTAVKAPTKTGGFDDYLNGGKGTPVIASPSASVSDKVMPTAAPIKNPPSKSPFNPNTPGNAEFNTQLNQRSQGSVKSFFSGLLNTFSAQNIKQTASNPLELTKPAPLEFKVGAGLDTKGQQNAKAQIIKEQQLGAQPVPQSPTNMDLGQEAKNLARLPLRAVAETTMSLLSKQNSTGGYTEPNQQETVTQSPFVRFLLGDETLKPLGQQAVEIEQQLKDSGFGKASTPLAILGVAGNTALALQPLTGGLNSLAEDALKSLAKDASTNDITITTQDIQQIIKGQKVEATKFAAVKQAIIEHPDLVPKDLNAPFAHEQLSPESKPFAHETLNAPFAHEPSVEPKTASEPTITPKTSVISYIDKNGEKVYTKLSPQELTLAQDEVKNIPIAKGGSQIHLDAVTPQQQVTGREISRAEFTAGHPQAQEVFNNIKPIETVVSKPTVEGETPSKIATSIEQKAVEQKLTQGFEGVAGYDKITIKDQAERATKLMSDPEKAMSVVRGESPLPDGLKGTALITAAEEHIARTGDVRMAYELANSPLVSETSAAAQELRLAAEREPDSLTAKLQEIKKAREEVATKKVGSIKKATSKITDDIRGEIKKVSAKPKDWASFIDQLKCT